MAGISLNDLDWVALWTWFLLFTRFSGLFQAMPGIGTDEVPLFVRGPLSLVLGGILSVVGARAPMPTEIADAGLMIATEYLLGWVLGAIPIFVLSAVAVSGQVTSAAIGLGQATLIDPSLGEPVSILSRMQSMIGTVVFLSIDGHHTLIRAASAISGDVALGVFRPDGSTATVLIDRFSDTFELAVMIAAPILVTVLVTQFLLGLLTKFVPQVNVFIISLPLTIGIGLFIIGYTLPTLGIEMVKQFNLTEELVGAIAPRPSPNRISP